MRRQFAGFAALGVLAVAVLAAPASSAPPTGLASYDAGADSVALDLRIPLLDQEAAAFALTAAATSSLVSSQGPEAAANGRSLATPLFSTDEAPSATPGGQPSNHVCAVEEELDLPDPLDLADPDLACVDTTATVTDGSPAATSDTTEIDLLVGGAGLTSEILAPLFEPVITPLVDGLAQLDPLIDVDAVVAEILASLADPNGTLLSVSVAPNESASSASAENGVLASAIARGAVIELLPDLPTGPLLTITVSQSEASVVRDATTGAATPVATPATVLIDWNTVDVPPITIVGEIVLPDITEQVEAGINDLISQLAAQSSPLNCTDENPLADLICLLPATGEILDAAGAAALGYDFGAGTVGARATALHLELLRAASPEGGIILDLATAVAAANAAPAIAPATTPPTTAPPTLARTGGDEFPLALTVGLGGLAVATALLVRRGAAAKV